MYHDGNSEPKGFGNIRMSKWTTVFRLLFLSYVLDETGVSLDDLDAVCARFEAQNVDW